jgi:hypothetical protein
MWAEDVVPRLETPSDDATTAPLVEELRTLASAVRNRGYSYV